MAQKIFVFETERISSDGRPYLLAIPENQITELCTVFGGHNVQLSVNSIPVKASFDSLINALGERVDMF
jgi:hypothetical protein